MKPYLAKKKVDMVKTQYRKLEIQQHWNGFLKSHMRKPHIHAKPFDVDEMRQRDL